MKWLRRHKGIALALKIVVTAAGLYYTFSKIDFASIPGMLGNVNLLLVVTGLIVLTVSKIISAYRSHFILKSIGISMSFRDNIKLFYLGAFYNTFLPGGIGGDAYKILVLGSHKVQRTKNITLAFFIDRLSGLWAIGYIALIMIFLKFGLDRNELITVGCTTLIIAAFPLKLFFIRLIYPKLQSIVLRMSMLSLGVQLTQIMAAVALLYSIHESKGHFQYILLFLISSIASVIPVSIGGLGVREAAAVFLNQLLQWQMSNQHIVGFTFLFFVISIVSSLPGAFVTESSLKIEPSAGRAVA